MTKAITFFDTCVRIGRSRAPTPPGNVIAAGDLPGVMERHHIVGAAVEHAVAMEASPRLGHETMAKEIANFAILRPAWNLFPYVSKRHEQAYTDPQEFLDAGTVLGRVDAQDFCHGKGDEAGFAPVLEACEAIHLPVFLDFRQQGDALIFDFGICERYPGIPFVIEGAGSYPFHRIMWCLRNYPNLYLSTIGFGVFNGVNMLCEELGPKRLIFGSNYPRQSIGMCQALILFAGISDADRQLIASGNFELLINGIG